MTKKEDLQKELQAKVKAGIKPSQIKKSRSAEDLKPKPNPETQEKEAQIKALTEQITRIKNDANQQIQFESQKAQNYLKQITKLTAELDTKEQTIKELTTAQDKLTDHNHELRLNKLKSSDQLKDSWKQEDNYFTKYQSEQKLTSQLKLQLAKLEKDLTHTQQDLKSTQRIIELRLPTNHKNVKEIDYWLWIRLGLLTLLTYLLLNNLAKPQKIEN